MSSETLSQHEIDALLKGGGSTAAAPAPVPVPDFATTRADAQVYDFRRPHRVSKEKLRALEAMYERFAKSLEGWLMGRMRGRLELRLQSVEQYSFGEFVLSLPMPCASYTFDIAGSGFQGVIDVGSDFAFYLVDRLFGGAGKAMIPQRAMTPIERMAVKVLPEKALSLLAEIWHDHIDLDFELSGFESIPEILRVANHEDPVLVANIEVVAGDQPSLILVCLPYGVVEKFFSNTDSRRVVAFGSQSEQESNRELTETSVRATRVPVVARLPEFRMPLEELARLTTGSVVTTGLSQHSPLTVLVGSRPHFMASPGRVNGRLAVKLTAAIDPDVAADSTRFPGGAFPT